MSDFIFAINVVLPIFMLIIAGYAARLLGLVSDAFWSEANRFVFRFPLPLMLFQNVRIAFQNDFTSSKLMLAAVAGIVVIIGALLIIVPICVKSRARTGSLIQGIFRSNFIIYGLPLARSIYGDEALIPVSCLLGVVVPIYNIAAVVILSFFSETRTTASISAFKVLKDILSNPLIIGSAAGAIVGVSGFSFPVFVETPVNEIAKMAAPLALIVMGAEFKFRNLRNNFLPVVLASLSKLVVIPLIAMIIFIALGFRQLELAVLLSLFATPTAVVSYIMSANMGCDGELSAQIVVLTTALSAFTIFLFVFALKSMAYL